MSPPCRRVRSSSSGRKAREAEKFAGSGHWVQAADNVANGSISGRIQNVVTGQYLNRARVTVKGTDQVAFTDEFGAYVIGNVRSGPRQPRVNLTSGRKVSHLDSGAARDLRIHADHALRVPRETLGDRQKMKSEKFARAFEASSARIFLTSFF